jgi:prepilin-type N-terminal cleavage/methylation domain-containing protein
MLTFRLKQRGDTIVEVMIAIAIVSLVLVTAYGVTNRNTLSIQATQEREQAQHLVEAQIEALRTAGGITTSGECFDGTTESATCDNFSPAGTGVTYTVKITGPAGLNHASPSTYMIAINWSTLTGNHANDGNVTMYYRLN